MFSIAVIVPGCGRNAPPPLSCSRRCKIGFRSRQPASSGGALIGGCRTEARREARWQHPMAEPGQS